MKKPANVKKSFPAFDMQAIPDVVSLVRDELAVRGVNRKLAQKTELLCEETLVMLLRFAREGAALQVQIRRAFGDISVDLSMPGTQFDPYADEPETEAAEDAGQELSEPAIRAILLRSHGENYKYGYKNGVSHVRILTGRSEKKTNNATLFALVLGILFGLLARFLLPQPVTEGISTWLLTPIRTMFMNALRIIIAPVVFFSIVSCFSQFRSLSDFGKLGAKVVGMYLLTTVFAILIGFGAFYLCRPGTWGFALSGASDAAAMSVDTDVEYGILPLLTGIVPSNFLAPFLESNTLQLIFLAVLCGVALGMIGQHSTVLKNLFDALNSLFLTITTMISKVIPVAAFASVSLMVIELGGGSLLTVLGASGVTVLALAGILCVYMLLIFLFTRLNPLRFFRKAKEGMLTSFTLCSSAAAMPTNMRICTDKLGVAPKVANFSIPLGTTINMDGCCIHFAVMGLFLARAYGVDVPVSVLLSLAITIILLSVGAPGVPGAGLVCMGIVLAAANVPVEAVGLIIAIDPILDMFITTSNTTGDLAAAVIVAKSENLLDEKIYNS